MPESEIARLHEQIEQEHAASVLALTGLASGTARHEFINARIERLEIYHHRLAELVGEKQATAFVCQILDTTPVPKMHEQVEVDRADELSPMRQADKKADVEHNI